MFLLTGSLSTAAVIGGGSAFAGVTAPPTDVAGTARQWVNVRTAAASTAASVGSLSGGQAVRIVCQVVGTTVGGPGGSTNLWDRVGDGNYVSHSYVASTATPYRCDALPVGTTRQWVNVRNAPASTAASVGSLSGGQAVTIFCQAVGPTVTGPAGATNLWDRIGDGRFVSHSYIAAAAGTPARCDAPAPSTPAPAPSTPAPAPSTPPSAPALAPAPSTRPAPMPALPPGLNAEQSAFLTTVAGPARQNFVENRVPASVTIAQAILESGWGRGDIPRTAHNYFGAKCNNGNKGTIAVGCRDFPTRECDASGCHAAVGSFRAYTGVLDSIRDHARILSTNARYATAFAYSHDANRFAAEIHKAGYATDPKYTELLTGIMKKFDLYRYDVR
jgi:flagellum-specific peptidoglycan hydrolase FlgJ